MSNSPVIKPRGSSLDDLLKADGVLEQFQATAKEVIAWQIQQAMTEKKQASSDQQ